MAITFPEGVDKELFYVPNSDLVLQFDEPTNSWNIVGPDNLATIDYVDQTIATDATKTYRNSSLHKETNELGVNTSLTVDINTSCFNSATSSFSSDLKYDYDNNILGPKDWNSPEYLIATKNTLPEWHDCVDISLPRGMFTYVGHDLETSNGSSEFRYILGFSMSKLDQNGDPNKLSPIIPGDTFELYLDSTTRSGGSEIKFALYEVVEVYDGANNVSVSVLFLDSDTPEENIGPGLTYQLYSYGRTLEKTGGKINGDLKIVSDSETAFEVWRTEESNLPPETPYDMVFKVDTSNNQIVVNDHYNNSLSIPAGQFHRDVNPLGVATIGYVNDRLGTTLDKRFTNEDGPYLRTEGGSIGFIEILNSALGGTQNLVVRGVTSTSNGKGNGLVLASLNNSQNNNLTEVSYFGPMHKGTEIVTKDYVDTLVANNKPDLSPYLRHDGNTRITGQLKLQNRSTTGYKTNIQEYDDIDIPCAKAVKNIQVATVFNGNSDDPGVLFEVSGVLYYNTYW